MNFLKRAAITAGLGMAALGAMASGHYTLKHFEANNINNISNMTARTQQTRNDLARYRDEGMITPEEDAKLYHAFGSFRDSLSDYFGLVSKESLDLRRNFQQMRHQSRISYSDWEKIDNVLKQYQQYLQTDEYRYLIGPQSADERAKRLLVSFLDG